MSPGRSRHRRSVAALCCAAVLSVLATAGAAGERFFSAIDDLPVMPALSEVPDSAMVFSKPEGRIVEVAATGAVEREAVLAFYRRTLPQLGWRAGAGDGWQRDGERLQLTFRTAPRGLLVQFSLAPR